MTGQWWVRQAARQAVQGWRAGDFTILALALFVAIFALATVQAISSRTSAALAEQSRQLVGGDAVLVSDGPTPPAAMESAKAAGLRAFTSVELNSMVGSTATPPQLGSIKALGEGRPLLGEYRLQSTSATPLLRPNPPLGAVWLSPESAERLHVAVGGSIDVGGTRFIVDGIVQTEPDRPLRGVEVGPRVIANQSDVDAAGLLGLGTRARWRYAITGTPVAVKRWIGEQRTRHDPGVRIETRDEIRPEIRNALDRAGKFLSITTLLTVVLSAVAIGMAARQHAEHQRGVAATLRAIGASQRDILGLYLGTLATVSLIVSTAAIAAAWLAQALGVAWIERRLGLQLGAVDVRAFAVAFGLGMLVLATFAAPPLVALRRVSALAVLRSDIRTPTPSALTLLALGLGAIFWLLWQAAGSPQAAAILLGGLLATIAVLAVLGFLLTQLVSRLAGSGGGVVRFALRNLARRRTLTMLQVVALGTSLMALILLVLVRTDLWNQWQQLIRADAPNRFIVNVQPDQRPVLDAALAKLHLPPAQFAPMVSARYVGPAPAQRANDGDENGSSQGREFRLSTTNALPSSNKVIAGNFWTSRKPVREFSVEQRFAQRLGWKLGDELAFDISGRRIEGRITSLREVRWESFQPNFFVIASADLLQDMPAIYITAVRVPVGNVALAESLQKSIPNANVIDIDAISGEIRRIADQAAMVIQVVFWFAFLAGCLVFAAAVAATREERTRELGIMRTLGASTRQMVTSQLVEFGALGAIAGLVAAVAASAIGAAFAVRVLELDANVNPSTLVIGALAGLLASLLAGGLSMRHAFRNTAQALLSRFVQA